jgi:hypothetical protein
VSAGPSRCGSKYSYRSGSGSKFDVWAWHLFAGIDVSCQHTKRIQRIEVHPDDRDSPHALSLDEERHSQSLYISANV